MQISSATTHADLHTRIDTHFTAQKILHHNFCANANRYMQLSDHPFTILATVVHVVKKTMRYVQNCFCNYRPACKQILMYPTLICTSIF